ncbi:MAG TPA: OmpA family protein, partial [Longimicrobium sp.]|nr:OmpA family protein [Longimicrobium sp.]
GNIVSSMRSACRLAAFSVESKMPLTPIHFEHLQPSQIAQLERAFSHVGLDTQELDLELQDNGFERSPVIVHRPTEYHIRFRFWPAELAVRWMSGPPGHYLSLYPGKDGPEEQIVGLEWAEALEEARIWAMRVLREIRAMDGQSTSGGESAHAHEPQNRHEPPRSGNGTSRSRRKAKARSAAGFGIRMEGKMKRGLEDQESDDRVSRWTRRLRDHPVFALIIAALAVLVAVGTGFENIEKIGKGLTWLQRGNNGTPRALISIDFRGGTSYLTPEAKLLIRAWGDSVSRVGRKIEVTGFADSSGLRSMSDSLAWSRAQVVTDELLRAGVDTSDIVVRAEVVRIYMHDPAIRAQARRATAEMLPNSK